MKNYRLCYLLAEFPEFTQTFVRDEIIEMQKQGVDISVVAQRPGKGFENKEFSAWGNTPVKYLTGYIGKPRELFLFFKFLISSPLKLTKTWRLYNKYNSPTLDYDFCYILYSADTILKRGARHIHVHFAARASELAMFVSSLTNIPFSITAHAHDIFKNQVQLYKKFSAAKYIIAISKYGKEYICGKISGNDPVICSKIHVIHCGIDTSLLKPNVKTSSNDFHIISVARLVEKKGIEYLIRACELIDKEHKNDFRCTIVGDGPLLINLRQLTHDLGLSNIINFVGAESHDAVLHRLHNADVFVLPCIVAKSGDIDGIPVSLMEAMAIGIPVISTDVSGVSELVHGGGYLTKPNSHKELATVIIKMMDMDNEKRESLGIEGRTIVNNEFNRQIEINKLKNLLFAP